MTFLVQIPHRMLVILTLKGCMRSVILESVLALAVLKLIQKIATH